MTVLHLIIVEDLEMDRRNLADLLQADCAGHEETLDLSFYASGEEFLALYRPKSCNGLFLDILLGGLNGIEVAEKVREAEPRLPIIFTTWERDYAVEGFAVDATDYLIKPLVPAQVRRCMERLREFLSRPSSISLLEISGRGHATPVDVAFEEILYAQCFNHVIDVHTLSGVYRTRMSFQDFSARFPHTGRFYICGRGLVVNLSLVAQVEGHVLLLKNGDKLPVPRSRRKEAQQAYMNWMFTHARREGWA